MSASSVQLVRLISFKTAARRTSSGASFTSESSGASATRPSLLGGVLGGRRRASSAAQGRFSTSPSDGNRGGEQGAGKDVVIEVLAHGASGKEAVLVAFLSNSVLLVVRIGAEGLRSWLLEWPVAGKIRGLCVSPDLQCVLCVTESLEGVYLLAIDDLGEQDEAKLHPTEAVLSLDNSATSSPHGSAAIGGGNGSRLGGTGGGGGTPDGTERGKSGGAKRSPAATARHAPKRTVADTAFPSLVHLASRGEQRKRAGSAKARHPPAEPVFIASLARRGAGGGGESKGRQESDDDRRGRRHSTGSGGRGPRRRGGSRAAAAPPFECLWWVTRDGDHFAIIGGPSGEVHFLDLERLGAWVVTPPPPAMARGRVCALSVVADLVGATRRPPPAPAGGDSTPSLPSEVLDTTAAAAAAAAAGATAAGNEQPHLVAVLETGAVYVVLLERVVKPSSGERATGRTEGGAESEAKDKNAKKNKPSSLGDSNNGGGGGSQASSGEYVRLGADREDRPEFAPSWLDVGRGGGGGGGGGMGVRAIAPSNPPGRLKMSIISRAWGNKCAVKILRVTGTPGAAAGSGTGDKEKEPQQGWGLEWGSSSSSSGSGKQQALRTETVRQITLPVDHPVPEQHALAAVDGAYAVLASPPAGGAPARVTVAPLGGAERPAAQPPVCVFPLPAGEHVRGVALLPYGGNGGGGVDDDGRATGPAVTSGPSSSSWGLVWSESCVYRVDLLGVDARAAAPKAVGAAGPASVPPKPRAPSTTPPRQQSLVKASGSIALRRPPVASVRRAHELHAAGELSEAAQVAIEALDGVQSSSSATPPRGAGGEATTRMVREELANSLLEWLVTLHVRQASADLRLGTGCLLKGEGAGGLADTAGGTDRGSHTCAPDKSNKIKARRSSAGLPAESAARGLQGRSARRGSNPTPPSRLAPKSRPKSSESSLAMPKTPKNISPVVAAAAVAAASLSQLERFLRSSRDYDPVLAATLLHEHGEADLAVVAGTARGGKGGGGGGGGGGAVAVLPKVLCVLAESAWPPRLGPRAVDALCRDETGAAARDAVHASGRTLFAALEPGLQLQVLLSHKSVMFGRVEAGGSGAGREERGISAVGEAAVPVEAGAGEAVAGIRRHLGPIVPALSAEELNLLVSRLAQWCKEDVTDRRSADGGREEAAAADRATPSVAGLEALEVLVRALCELGRRPPPAGERHGRAWSHAGCIIDEPASHERRVPGAPPLEWAQLTAALCDILSGEGAAPGSDENGGDAGGLPTVARRRLLCVLPLVWGWHDPVGVLLRLREAGCWAAVALQLELSGNEREAASATLHGVVAHLQGGETGAQGETARILSGKALRTGLDAREPSSSPGTPIAVADTKRTASEAVLRVVDRHALPPRRRVEDSADGGDTVKAAASSPATAAILPASSSFSSRLPTAAPTSAVVLERASVLAEALCVWKYFGLPLAALEASLRPRLEDGDGVRVLTAVFFPRLSRDSARNGALSRDPLGQEGQRGARGSGGGGGRGTQTAEHGAFLRDLGLSPRFFLALTRAAGKPAVLGSVTSSSHHKLNDRRSAVGPATPLGPSTLTLLLEHLAGDGGGSELDSSWVRLGAAAPGSSSTPVGRRWGRVEVGSAWRPVPGNSGAQGYAPSSDRAAAVAAADNADAAVWFFSCGHRFSRQDLLDSVVPASASSVMQATASLERTQQVLALEYEGRNSAAAEAACPECAAKELVRLAAVAGSSMRARGTPTTGGSSSPLPPPPPQRLPTQERPRVR